MSCCVGRRAGRCPDPGLARTRHLVDRGGALTRGWNTDEVAVVGAAVAIEAAVWNPHLAAAEQQGAAFLLDVRVGARWVDWSRPRHGADLCVDGDEHVLV